MKQFKFFYGYKEKSLTEQWEELMRQYPTSITPWDQITPITTVRNEPLWQVFPGSIRYDNPIPTYTTYTIPANITTTTPNFTVTNTPANYHGQGYFTITNTGMATSGTLTTSGNGTTTCTTVNFQNTGTSNAFMTQGFSSFTSNIK